MVRNFFQFFKANREAASKLTDALRSEDALGADGQLDADELAVYI